MNAIFQSCLFTQTQSINQCHIDLKLKFSPRSSRRSSRPRPRIDDSTDEGSNVENVTETQPGPASEEQGLGEESEESLEEMIVDRSKKGSFELQLCND